MSFKFEMLAEKVNKKDFAFLESLRLPPKLNLGLTLLCELAVQQGRISQLKGATKFLMQHGVHDANMTHLKGHGLVDRPGTGITIMPKALRYLIDTPVAKGKDPSPAKSVDFSPHDNRSKQIYDDLKKRTVNGILILTLEVRQDVMRRLNCTNENITHMVKRNNQRGLIDITARDPYSSSKGVRLRFKEPDDSADASMPQVQVVEGNVTAPQVPSAQPLSADHVVDRTFVTASDVEHLFDAKLQIIERQIQEAETELLRIESVKQHLERLKSDRESLLGQKQQVNEILRQVAQIPG